MAITSIRATLTGGVSQESLQVYQPRLETYDGEDLTVKFANEIAGYDNVWQWIKARLTNKNLDGLFIKDYIPWTSTDGYQIESQIAGINQYLGGEQATLTQYHIDFISRDCWPQSHVWNKANYNNGVEDNTFPYLASDIKLWLNAEIGTVPNENKVNPETIEVDYSESGVFARIPNELKEVITEKQMYLNKRYSSEGILAKDTAVGWATLGKLWLLSEVEVYGHNVKSDPFYSGGNFAQYPIFRDNKMRIKRNTQHNSNPRVPWWLLNQVNSSISSISMISQGVASTALASDNNYAPICFRIAG